MRAPALASRVGNRLFDISFESNIKEVEDTLRATERWVIPYATATALSRTAFDARASEMSTIAGVFDRPTPFTIKSILYKKASADNLTYRIFVRDEASRSGTPPATYLRPQVHGGPRRAKPFEMLLRRAGVMRPDEFAIPAIGIKRNAYGNLPAATLSKILSQMKARRDTAQNTTKRSAKRNKKGEKYFLPNEATRRRLPRGIYERLEGGKIRAVLLFVSSAPHYRKRYEFGRAARVKAQRVFGPHFKRAFDEMRAKQGIK